MQHEETGNQGNPQYVLPETTALVVIGCLDLLSTVYLVGTKRASELNPLMLWLLQTFGSNGFVLGKALLLGIPLMIAERARRHNPAFVRSPYWYRPLPGPLRRRLAPLQHAHVFPIGKALYFRRSRQRSLPLATRQ
jgi:hypothetical protein